MQSALTRMYYVNVTHAFTSSHFSSVQFHVLVATEIPLGLSPVGSVAHGVICGVAMVGTRPSHRPKAAPQGPPKARPQDPPGNARDPPARPKARPPPQDNPKAFSLAAPAKALAQAPPGGSIAPRD